MADQLNRTATDDEIARIKSEIDEHLRRRRPDRYMPGHEFLDEVADLVAASIPVTMARNLLARDLVGQREGQATRRGNRFLKTLLLPDGQRVLPIDWHVYVDEPVAIHVPEIDRSGTPTGDYRRERVALRAMTDNDWHNFSVHGRVDLQHRVDAEMAMYDSADWLADQQRGMTFAEWAETVAPVARAKSA